MTDARLSDIVIVNENRHETIAGCVSVFRSADDACASLEPWWVEQHEGFAITAAGHRLKLGVGARQNVVIVQREETPSGAEQVRSWLKDLASSVSAASTHKANKKNAPSAPHEERRELPSSIEDLIAYVGFDR